MYNGKSNYETFTMIQKIHSDPTYVLVAEGCSGPELKQLITTEAGFLAIRPKGADVNRINWEEVAAEFPGEEVPEEKPKKVSKPKAAKAAEPENKE